MITTLTPIIVATSLSFCFKSTRGIGILGVALMSYFYTGPFLVIGSIAGALFSYWKYWRK